MNPRGTLALVPRTFHVYSCTEYPPLLLHLLLFLSLPPPLRLSSVMSRAGINRRGSAHCVCLPISYGLNFCCSQKDGQGEKYKRNKSGERERGERMSRCWLGMGGGGASAGGQIRQFICLRDWGFLCHSSLDNPAPPRVINF